MTVALAAGLEPRGRALGRRLLASPRATAFALYLLVAFLYFGLRVVASPRGSLIGNVYTDPETFVWAFAWWPHALLHGQNPFVTHDVWAPSGFDLAWSASVPALALAFAPVTLLVGPLASYDVACVVVVALAAWCAFLLCREITRSFWPSLLGGYLYGFSSHMLGGVSDHLHTLAFVPPVAALILVRFVRGELGARPLAIRLGLLLALEAYISTEILFTLTLALVASLVLALLLVPEWRSRLVRLLAPVAGAYLLAGALAAPLLAYALSGYGSKPPAGNEAIVTDAANFVVPTELSFGGWWSGGLAGRFPGRIPEQGSYLGLPALVIVCWFAVRFWRKPPARFLLAGFLLAAVASLGSWLTIGGRRLVVLPWVHLAGRPLFEVVIPARLSLYTALATCVVAAWWAASSPRGPRWLRVAIPALAVLALLPNVFWRGWARTPRLPQLFTTTSLYRSCLSRGANVLPIPTGARGDSLLWQVESGFWFRLSDGYVSPAVPPAFEHPQGVQRIAANDLPPKVTVADVREFVRLEHVSAIVLDPRLAPAWRPLLARLARPVALGGVLIYRFGRGVSDCSADELSET